MLDPASIDSYFRIMKIWATRTEGSAGLCPHPSRASHRRRGLADSLRSGATSSSSRRYRPGHRCNHCRLRPPPRCRARIRRYGLRASGIRERANRLLIQYPSSRISFNPSAAGLLSRVRLVNWGAVMFCTNAVFR